MGRRGSSRRNRVASRHSVGTPIRRRPFRHNQGQRTYSHNWPSYPLREDANVREAAGRNEEERRRGRVRGRGRGYEKAAVQEQAQTDYRQFQQKLIQLLFNNFKTILPDNRYKACVC